jgi:alkyl sulfatase BDS1-like metallo-beta-lactamase superfamily hydrolase
MAENATHTLHNLLTLRGAEVRDARAWSRYLAEAIQLYGDKAEVVFASHHWPTWGRDRIVGFLSQQRDLYGYLHDQTLMMNILSSGAEPQMVDVRQSEGSPVTYLSRCVFWRGSVGSCR